MVRRAGRCGHRPLQGAYCLPTSSHVGGHSLCPQRYRATFVRRTVWKHNSGTSVTGGTRNRPVVRFAARRAGSLFPCSGHQPEFLLAGQLFDGRFPPHGLRWGIEGLIIAQFHGPPGPGVFGPFPGVVGFHAVLQIVGPAGVQRSVGAPEDIRVTAISFHEPQSGESGRRRDSPGCHTIPSAYTGPYPARRTPEPRSIRRRTPHRPARCR